jgi:hypothetical protein
MILDGAPAHFMKIDVEGMEHQVLRGATKTLSVHRPTIVFETLVDSFSGENIEQCERLLRSHGYHLFGFNQEHRKLTPVTYPGLQEDTLAIHSTSLIDAAEILYNASQYLCTDSSGASSTTVTITAAEDSVPYVKLERGDTTLTAAGERRNLHFDFSLNRSGKTENLSLQISEDFLTCSAECSSEDGKILLCGKLVGVNFR